MKRRTIYLLLAPGLIFILSYYAYKQIQNKKEAREHATWVETLESTKSTNVKILEDAIGIDYLKEKRSLSIYLPEGYENDSLTYPVIYFLDGQSLFDQKIQEGTEWQVDEVLDSIALSGGQKAIVVGIYSSEDRLREYKPFPSTKWYSHKRVSGDQHAEWIVKTLKPWVDNNYRTKYDVNSTIIGGASLGGLMSYYMLMEYPSVFGGAIVFSPSYWVNPIVYDLHLENDRVKDQKIFLNAGELETPTVDGIKKMRDILLEYGVDEDNITLEVEEGEGHWHMSWRKGFKKAYPWILEN